MNSKHLSSVRELALDLHKFDSLHCTCHSMCPVLLKLAQRIRRFQDGNMQRLNMMITDKLKKHQLQNLSIKLELIT